MALIPPLAVRCWRRQSLSLSKRSSLTLCARRFGRCAGALPPRARTFTGARSGGGGGGHPPYAHDRFSSGAAAFATLVPNSDRPLTGPPGEIQLSAKERKVTQFLLDVLAFHDSDATLRVAGGWVRNKLLGLESDDLDIVTDKISGTELADLITEFQRSRRMHTSAVGIIHRNPEQSKHLETVTIRLFGLDIDINQLRSETYADGSRIPTVTVAEPLEDALRRDFTLNALFYNIGTACVEDFTGLGRKDLAAGLLRTPLDAAITLRDDPLRLLRGLRFQATYNFSLDDSFVAAAQQIEMCRQLEAKVSRERIGIEVGKMFSTAGFPVAVRALRELNLEGAVLGTVTGDAVRQEPEFTSAVVDAICALLPKDDLPAANCSASKMNAPVDVAVALAVYLLAANPHCKNALAFRHGSQTADCTDPDRPLPHVSESFGAVTDASLMLKRSNWIHCVLQPNTATASHQPRMETQTLSAAQRFSQAMHACFMETEKELDAAVCRRLKLPRKLVRRAARLQCAALTAVSLDLLPVALSSSRNDGGSSFEDFVLFGLWLQWAKEEDWEDALRVAFAIDSAKMGSHSVPDFESLRHAYVTAARAISDSPLRQVAQAAPCVNGGEIIGAGVSGGPHVGLLLAATKVIEIGAVFTTDAESINQSDDARSILAAQTGATRLKVLAWIKDLANCGDLQ